MDEMEYKAAPLEIKADAQVEGKFEGHFAIFGNVDDGGDIVHPGAFAKTLQERKGRIQQFYLHNWDRLTGPPPEVVEEDATGLHVAGRVTVDAMWGHEVWALMKDSALREGSFGYETIKSDQGDVNGRLVRNLRELKLYEVSFVPLGMNALTTVRAVKRAALQTLKAALPAHTTATAPEDEAWDAAAVLREVSGARQLRLVHAWVDPDGDPEAKGSYKLPHHRPDGQVVWRGVSASGAALMGSRGGVDIPEADVAGTKAHLARHYAQFEQTPPWAESASLESYLAALESITTELKEGRVLSGASKEKVVTAMDAMRGAIGALEDLLAAAEPQPPKAAHSALLLVQRLRAAELALALGNHYA